MKLPNLKSLILLRERPSDYEMALFFNCKVKLEETSGYFIKEKEWKDG